MSLRQMPSLTESVSAIKLQAEIRQRTGGRVRNLQVHLTEDELVLTGLSGTFYAKQLAQHAAMDLVKLPILANDIEVC